MGAYSVKPLIPRHIPASFPGPLRSSAFPFLRRGHGGTVKVLPYNPIRDGSVLCETVDSRTHSGFVPRAFTLLRFPILWERHGSTVKVLPYNPIRDGSVPCETVDSRTHSGFVRRAFTLLRFPIPWSATG